MSLTPLLKGSNVPTEIGSTLQVQIMERVADRDMSDLHVKTSGTALCCKNRPTSFRGRMSYKATKPGLVLFYILACFNCIVAY